MPRALRIAPLLALLSTTCGWGSGGKVCAAYQACCKEVMASPASAELLDERFRCMDYADETTPRFCEKELLRVIGDLTTAGLPVSPLCELPD